METTMPEGRVRKSVDCRRQPSEMNCSVKISADTEPELVEAAAQHAVSVHGHKDTPELREQIRRSIESEYESA